MYVKHLTPCTHTHTHTPWKLILSTAISSKSFSPVGRERFGFLWTFYTAGTVCNRSTTTHWFRGSNLIHNIHWMCTHTTAHNFACIHVYLLYTRYVQCIVTVSWTHSLATRGHLANGADPVIILTRSSVQSTALDVEDSRTAVTAEHLPSLMTHPAVGVILGDILRSESRGKKREGLRREGKNQGYMYMYMYTV